MSRKGHVPGGKVGGDPEPASPQGNGPGTGPDPDNRLNWSRLEPKKASQRVWQMVDTFEKALSWRHFMALRGAAAYASIGLGDLFENLSPYDGPGRGSGSWERKGRDKYRYGGWGNKDHEAHARAATETVVEKLLGLRQTKTQLVGTDLEWELRRQGIWADRFMEGNFHLQQGSFSDMWDLWRQGALLSWVSTGTVAARTEPDYVSKRVRTQLRSTLNTFIDPGDVANGMPLSYFDITWENPEYLIEDERFKGHADAIWKASKVPPQHEAANFDGATFGTRMTKVCTAWRMKFGSFTGRKAYFVQGAPPIFWDDWKHDYPELAFYRCNRCLGETFWGENFIESALNPLADAEYIDTMAQEVMRLTSQTYLGLDGTTTAPSAVLNAKFVNVFRFDSNKGEKPPWIDKPEILNEQYLEYRREKIATAMKLLGIPDLHIASESGAHLESGRAIRLEASLLPERFARKLRGLDTWLAVDIGNQQIRAAREIGKVDPDWQVTWPGVDFEAKVKVEVLDIDTTQFQLRPYAVGELKNTPQERAQFAQEMYDRKEISQGQLSLILNGLYDVPKETKEVDAQRVYLAKTMDDMLHADKKVVADTARYLGDRYQPPDPWTDPASAVAQIIPVYRRAIVDGVPQNRRILLRRLLEDVLAIQMQNARDAAAAQASVSIPSTMGEALPAGPGAAAEQMLPQAGMQQAPPQQGQPMVEQIPQNVGGPPGIA